MVEHVLACRWLVVQHDRGKRVVLEQGGVKLVSQSGLNMIHDAC